MKVFFKGKCFRVKYCTKKDALQVARHLEKEGYINKKIV